MGSQQDLKKPLQRKAAGIQRQAPNQAAQATPAPLLTRRQKKSKATPPTNANPIAIMSSQGPRPLTRSSSSFSVSSLVSNFSNWVRGGKQGDDAAKPKLKPVVERNAFAVGNGKVFKNNHPFKK